MRFKTYLTESSNPLAKYRKNLDLMIERNLALFRGMRTEDKFKVGDYRVTIPTTGGPVDITTGNPIEQKGWTFDVSVFDYPARKEPRMSKIGSNVFLDLGSMWEGFPNRRLSTFTTQKTAHTDMFGKFGAVIPADNVDLYGYSPTDFNESKAKSAPAQHRAKVEKVMAGVQNLLSDFTMAIANMEKSNEFRLRLLDAKTDYGVEEIDSLAVYRMNFGKKVMNVAELVDWAIRYYDKLKKMERDTIYSDRLLDSIAALKEHMEAEGLASIVDVFKSVSPEKYKAKAFTSLEQIPVKDTASEIWFVGDFLFVEMPLSGRHFDRADVVTVLKELRNKA
jgi:hypothetical protein